MSKQGGSKAVLKVTMKLSKKPKCPRRFSVRSHEKPALISTISAPTTSFIACLEVKMIGKPYAGELHVRFDEGEQVFVALQILNGHEAGNGGDKPRIDLTNAEPVLYSTRTFPQLPKS